MWNTFGICCKFRTLSNCDAVFQISISVRTHVCMHTVTGEHPLVLSCCASHERHTMLARVLLAPYFEILSWLVHETGRLYPVAIASSFLIGCRRSAGVLINNGAQQHITAATAGGWLRKAGYCKQSAAGRCVLVIINST